MDEKLILARMLLDWTLNSKTSFVDENDKLLQKAKLIGMQFPNPDLALFETIYCELDTPNRNNAMLPAKVAEEGLASLIGKQINFEHAGAGHICGYIIDARIENNFVIIDGVLFKSIWRDEFEDVKKAFEQGKLFVSFELWNKENGSSILDERPDGVKVLRKMIAHGCGLLMKEKPACPKAQVFKLMASQKLVDQASQINEPVKKLDDELVYAELCITEECKHCATCVNERRDNNMDFEDTEVVVLAEEIRLTDEDIKLLEAEEDVYDVASQIEEAAKLSYEKRQGLKDSDFALVIKKGDKTIRKYPIHDAAHVRNALARLGQDAAKATLKKLGVSVESVLKKVKSKAKKFGIETACSPEEPKKIVKTTRKVMTIQEFDDGSTETTEENSLFTVNDEEMASILEEAAIPAEVIKRMKELIKEGKAPKEAVKQAWSEHKKEQEKAAEELQKNTKVCKNCGQSLGVGQEGEYCPACARIAALEQCLTAKEEEIKVIKAEIETLKAANDSKVKEITETKDKEVAKLQEELGKIRQEIELAKVKEGQKPDLTVGSVAPDGDFYKELQKKVNQKAFGHD